MMDFLVLGATIAAGVKISQIAQKRGRSGAWGLIVVPAAGIPWVVAAVVATFVVLGNAMQSGAQIGLGANIGVSIAATLGALGGLGLAYLGFDRLASTVQAAHVAGPAPAYSGVPVQQPPQPAARRAGYCMDCGKNVWLTGGGSCPAGHGPQSLTDCYTVQE
jgi:hypothetical protein